MKRNKAKKTLQKPKANNGTSSKRVAAGKKPPIGVLGWEVFLRWIPITEHDFQRLTVVGASIDDVRARFNKRRGVLLGAHELRDIRLQRESSAILQFSGNAKYFLIVEDWQWKGLVKEKSERVFDGGKLCFGVARCSVTEESAVRNIVYFGFNADAKRGFEVFDVDSKKSIYYLVTRDNKRYPVIFKYE